MRNPPDRSVGTSQKDCACAVTRIMKVVWKPCILFFLFFNIQENGIKKCEIFYAAKISANLRKSEAEMFLLSFWRENILTKSVHTCLGHFGYHSKIDGEMYI